MTRPRPPQKPPAIRDAIGYRRVSTREQGRSGLGLAAQRDDIRTFAAREGWAVRRWYQDIQTGAGKDALLLRPGLASALKEARVRHCPLIVSRLDRLSRNVHFITGLMEHKVHFMVAALGRDCDAFTLHIYASMAEQERKMISERITAALAVRRRQGQVLGLALRSKAQQREMRARARAALRQAATERAEGYRVHIEWALRQPGIYGTGRPISFRAAADRLNERKLPSPMGGRWGGYQLMLMARRLGLRHPRGHLLRTEAEARIQALWAQHPHYSAKQIVAHLAPQFPLGITRAQHIVRACRAAAVHRSALYQQVGWPLDRCTTARLRVAAIWKTHPQFTAQQVIQTLGRGPFLTKPWVQKVLRECWRACGRHSPTEWLTGRRRYHRVRARHRT